MIMSYDVVVHLLVQRFYSMLVPLLFDTPRCVVFHLSDVQSLSPIFGLWSVTGNDTNFIKGLYDMDFMVVL